MNISIGQYNTVINGLRTQLELQRGQIQERGAEVEALQHYLGEAREGRERDAQKANEAVRGLVDNCNKLRDQVDYCHALATDGSTLPFCGKTHVHCNASAAVEALVKERDEVRLGRKRRSRK